MSDIGPVLVWRLTGDPQTGDLDSHSTIYGNSGRLVGLRGDFSNVQVRESQDEYDAADDELNSPHTGISSGAHPMQGVVHRPYRGNSRAGTIQRIPACVNCPP